MPSWKEIYARQLESAVFLYANQDFARLGLMLEMMAGQIYHEEAAKELKDFTTNLDNERKRQEADIDRFAQTMPTYGEKRLQYNDLDRVQLWYLTELMKKHQQLAQKYDLLPKEADIIKGV